MNPMMTCLDAESVVLECYLTPACSMHCSCQQISMSAERTVTTVGRSASTHLAAMSACVLEGSCYTEMDGVVSVSITKLSIYV